MIPKITPIVKDKVPVTRRNELPLASSANTPAMEKMMERLRSAFILETVGPLCGDSGSRTSVVIWAVGGCTVVLPGLLANISLGILCRSAVEEICGPSKEDGCGVS